MSVLAVSVQLYGQSEIVDIVRKESFFPSPKVDSAILRIASIHDPFCHSEVDTEESLGKLETGSQRSFASAQDDSKRNAHDDSEKIPKQVRDDARVSVRDDFERSFFRLVHIGFSARRKTLLNNLMAGYQLDREKVIDILKKVGLKETVRAQELSVKDWENLLKIISSKF
jgi:16S rRNA (adenine1518-N6/adenine1519-N6)-dimethyltransferase